MNRYYPYYSYQEGGERNLPVPAPQGVIPLPPVVTNPRDFARLYGMYSGVGSDVGSYAGVPGRATMDARFQQEQAMQEAARRMVEERKKKSRVTHTPVARVPNPSVSDMGMRDPGLSAGDLADQNGVLLPSKLRGQLVQGLNEKQQLENRLMRLGYSEQQAAALGRSGRSQLHPSIQKQLEDQELTDYRVMHHPDYDPHVPVEEQQGLSDDTSLRAMVLRGKNMLLNSGNPVGDFVTRMATGPAQSFANLTMDAENQYVKPGLAQGALNFGQDVMNVLPGLQEQAATSIVNRASPRALSYLANPAVQGAEDFGKWYIPRAAASDNLPALFPRHSAFTKNVDALIQQGVPFKDAVRSSYLGIKGDNLKGFNLIKGESPREVFNAVEEAKNNLAEGKKWMNPSYSLDSYPLMLDYVSKRMDPNKYDIIPTYKYEGFNGNGYKSGNLWEALPEIERPLHLESADQLNSMYKKQRDLEMHVSKSTEQDVKKKLQRDLRNNRKETSELMENMQKKLRSIFLNNPEVPEHLRQGYNNRIQAINQRFGVNIPLVSDDDVFDLKVPQFYIYRKSTNPLSDMLNFPSKIGLNPFAIGKRKDAFLSKLATSRPANDVQSLWDVNY